MLTFLLLGPPQILRDGAPVDLPRRRTRALAYYLAAQPGAVSREQLLALLWPDHERPAAQQILRTTLHSARKAIGPALVAADDSLAIAGDALVDLRALAAAVGGPAGDEAALAAALARYRGDLLDGFSLPDSDPFERWAGAERERARLLAIRGFTALARHAEARRDYRAALDALSQALALDPLQEDVQRIAIRLHYRNGDRVGAIRRYEQLRDLLDAEMGVPPMAETRALYDAVVMDTLDPHQRDWEAGGRGDGGTYGRAHVSAPRPAPAPQLPFTGRAIELERLHFALGAGRLALIEGAPGIGKTRLAEEVLAGHAGLALTGTGHELEQQMPYHPLLGALRELFSRGEWPALRAQLALEPIWAAEVTRLLPELAHGETPLPAPADEARLWEALARLLTALAKTQPLLLLIDDLQWADSTTLGLIGYLLRRSAGAPLRIIATTRPVELRTTLAGLLTSLTREGRIERVSLDRLNPAETLALARHLSPSAAAPLAEWLDRNAEGNPYILSELVLHARAGGLLLDDGTLNLDLLSASPVVPQTVYSLIEARLARLSDAARRVLDAAVAIGREFSFDLAARAAALSEAAALDALDELRGARLVYPLAGGLFRFDHSLTMEVAYLDVGEPRHQLIHRRVAEALESLHADRADAEAGLIASHFLEGGAPERAASYALRAARQAADLAAWAEAVRFYEQALIGLPKGERLAALMALGDAQFHAGRAARATERFREALALASDPHEVNRSRLALARSLIPQGRYREVVELVLHLDRSSDPEEAATARFLWGTALSLEGADLAGAAERLRAAEDLLIARPIRADHVALAQVRFELGGVAAQQGDLARAVGYYHEAMAVADQPSDDHAAIDGALTWRILARNNLAYHLHLLGDLDEAARYQASAMRLSEERGAIGLQPYILSTGGEIAMARGDLDAAERLFAAGLALAEQLGVPERVAGLTANLGLVDARRGRRDAAVQRLVAAMAQADALGTHHLATQIRIWLAPLLPPAEARAILAEARARAMAGGRARLLSEIDQLAP